MVDAIEEIKEADSEIGNKSLNVTDIEVGFEQTVFENQYISDDLIRENI